MASVFVRRAVRVRSLAGDIVLCSWARHFTLTVLLSTQVYKWVPANLMLGVPLRWTDIPSRRIKNTPSRFILQIISGLMDHLAHMQTLPLHHHVNITVSLLLKIDITWSKFLKKLCTTACWVADAPNPRLRSAACLLKREKHWTKNQQTWKRAWY